jgi:hypothetical protein
MKYPPIPNIPELFHTEKYKQWNEQEVIDPVGYQRIFANQPKNDEQQNGKTSTCQSIF